MSLRRAIIALVVVAVALAGVFGTQRRLDALRVPADPDASLLYLPNEKLLDYFTAGMSSVVADLLWLQCVQYIAVHYQTDKKFVWLNHMCAMITRLDPHFVAAYRYGGVFLSDLKADDDAGLDLLRCGIVNNPTAWELPYECSAVYLLNRAYLPWSETLALAYMQMAIETGHAPERVVRHAEALLAKSDRFDVERQMWEAVLKEDDAFMRQFAQRKLAELDLRIACRDFNEAAGKYKDRFGQPPKEVQDLFAKGLLSGRIPEDPLGGRFFIDRDGIVQETTLLDEEMARDLNVLDNVLERFHRKYGHWPAALDELVTQGFMFRLPVRPYKDRGWRYDAQTGKVE